MKYQKSLLAAGIALSLTTLTAQASLTAGISDGKSVVYDDVTNITWTGDANLLGTLEISLGYTTVVDAIIAASPKIYDTANYYDTPTGSNSGHHDVTSADFSSSQLGKTSWFGALAFTSYLNSISYAGSNQWALPSAGANPQYGYNQTSTQFGELFYNELGGTAGQAIPDTNNFTNEQIYAYWLGTEHASYPLSAWYFYTGIGGQDDVGKSFQMYAWAVSPGNVAAPVPVPAAAWLFGSALFGFMGWRRRGNLN